MSRRNAHQWEPGDRAILAEILTADLEKVRAMNDTETLVIDDIRKRQELGIKKYGTTVAQNALTHAQWLQHAYEEALDMAIYLKRAMQEQEV